MLKDNTCFYLKYITNKCVLRYFLNKLGESQSRNFMGNLFHSRGANVIKRLSPAFVDEFGTQRMFSLDDLRFRVGLYGTMSSERYTGAQPWMQLKQITIVL